jgi:hypothetical protein
MNNKGREVGSTWSWSSLGSLARDRQVSEALPELATLLRQGQWFLADGASAEVLAEFLKDRTKASGDGETAEAAHRVIALFDGAVICF